MKQDKHARFTAISFLVILIASSLASADPAYNNTQVAEGGNITLLSMDGNQQTSTWQGYFGTVSGGLILGNSQGDTIYDWSIVQARGEILAVRSIISDWSTINCSTQNEIYDEQYRLNIPNSSSDSINITYQNTTHPAIEIGLTSLSGCRSTLTDNSTQKEAKFWNVLLNVDENTTVYAAILDDDQVSFNGTTVDYQLIVPTNRTTYQAVYNIYLDLT